MKLDIPKVSALLALIPAMFMLSLPSQAQTAGDGQVRQSDAGVEVWSEADSMWVKPEVFWESYARESNGKYWGRSVDYPPYNDVSEHDTLMIQNEDGACLMYFFHSRWRRAQDVRRWDPAQNQIGGCPRVFE